MSQEFTPYLPSIFEMMPEGIINATTQKYGIRIGWCKGRSCPCAGNGGQPNTGCLTCSGRGTYWDKALPFMGKVTFGHNANAPEEPGQQIDPAFGKSYNGTPTLSIPHNGPNNENIVWNNCGELDAFVLLDDITRLNSVFVSGVQAVLPYEYNVTVIGVIIYNSDQSVSSLPASGYTASNGIVELVGQPNGTKFTVEYSAAPVYVAFRKAGGVAHARPLGGTLFSGISKRYHIMTLDVWLRSRYPGDSINTNMKQIPTNTSGSNIFG